MEAALCEAPSAELAMAKVLYHPLVLGSLICGSLPIHTVEAFSRDEAYLEQVLASRITGKGAVMASGKTEKITGKGALITASRETEKGSRSSRRLQQGREVQASPCAQEMGAFILCQGEMELDVVLVALHYIRVRLSDILRFSTTPPLSSSSSSRMSLLRFSTLYEELCDTPLLEKSVWRQKFLLEELEEGTHLMDHLHLVFKLTLDYQERVLSSLGLSSLADLNLQEQSQSARQEWILCTDFDDTCTTHDTTEALVGVAGRDARWREIMDDVSLSMDDCLGSDELSGDDDSSMEELLLRLEMHEKKADQQVMSEGLLKGIHKGQLRAAAVTLRPNCDGFLSSLADRPHAHLHIISSNWSQDLIRYNLPPLDGQITIHSNDLNWDGSGVCDGTIRLVVQDSFQKCSILRAIREANSTRLLVYIGDSINDVLALLDADVGIVMGTNQLLHELASRYSIHVIPLPVAASRLLLAASNNTDGSFRQSRTLFQASGWAEVEHFFLSL